MRPTPTTLVALLLLAPFTNVAADADTSQRWVIVDARLDVEPGTVTAGVAHHDLYVATITIRNDGGPNGGGRIGFDIMGPIYSLPYTVQVTDATLAPGETRVFRVALDVSSGLHQIWFFPGPAWLCGWFYSGYPHEGAACWSIWIGTGFIPQHYPQDIPHPLGFPY